jgi:hypothetical protein
MRKWSNRIAGVILISSLAYGAYLYFAGGYHTRPDIPAGAFSASFKNGLRAIIDRPDERSTRRYLGVPFDVPFWAEDAWAFCSPPTKKEASDILEQIDMGPGSRLDAICKITADDTLILRGAVFSVPRL